MWGKGGFEKPALAPQGLWGQPGAGPGDVTAPSYSPQPPRPGTISPAAPHGARWSQGGAEQQDPGRQLFRSGWHTRHWVLAT